MKCGHCGEEVSVCDYDTDDTEDFKVGDKIWCEDSYWHGNLHSCYDTKEDMRFGFVEAVVVE